MKTCLRASAIAVALSLALTGAALAYQFGFGALRTDAAYEDKIDFAPDRRFNLPRHQIQIPKAYGRLITITGSARGAVFWFESSDGSIRNVAVDATAPLIIDRGGELN